MIFVSYSFLREGKRIDIDPLLVLPISNSLLYRKMKGAFLINHAFIETIDREYILSCFLCFFVNLALVQVNNRGYLLSREMRMVGFYL